MIINTEAERGFLVTLYLTFRCNFRCSYCCSHTNSQRYHSDLKLTDAFKVLDKLRDFGQPVVLSLLGGEPTLCKDLYKLIDYAESIDNITAIELYTNGTKPIRLSPKLIPVISVHNNPRFFKIIYGNMLGVKGHKHRIKLMLSENFDFPYDLNGFNCFGGYIEDVKEDTFIIYPKKFDLEDRKTINYNGKMISQRNYLKYLRKDHRICYPREIEIFPNLHARSCCNLLNINGNFEEVLEKSSAVKPLKCTSKCTCLEFDHDLD